MCPCERTTQTPTQPSSHPEPEPEPELAVVVEEAEALGGQRAGQALVQQRAHHQVVDAQRVGRVVHNDAPHLLLGG